MSAVATPSDEDLVRAAQRGQRWAFETLVQRTARLVFSRVYLEIRDAHRAEDVVQETFLIAWRSIAQVSDPSGFRKWLMSIAHTAVIDAQRRESRKKRASPLPMSGPEAMSQAPDQRAGPESAAELNEEQERALAALEALPEEYRTPLMLRYLAGADYQTIGRQLALTNGSLRGLLSRGLEMLRKQLSHPSPAPARSPRSN